MTTTTDKPKRVYKRKPGFPKGVSGNPKGRPKGEFALAGMDLKKKIAEYGPELINIIVDKMRSGDMAACKLFLERLVPAAKDLQLKIDLPFMRSLMDVDNATDKIIENVTTSKLTPIEGESLLCFIEAKRKALVSVDLEQRIMDLEKKAEENS